MLTPIDHAGETVVAHQEMLGTEVGVEERRREIHERLRLAEESSCLCSPVTIEDREHEPFELRALFAVSLDPVLTVNRKRG